MPRIGKWERICIFEGSRCMNLKDEIVVGESYSLEFKRVPNEDREKYPKTVKDA